MASILFTNNALSKVAASITATDTTLTLLAGTGADFPVITNAGDYFYVTIEAVDDSILEIVKVIATSGDSFTIERALEGTTAVAWPVNADVQLRLTAQGLVDFREEMIFDATQIAVNAADAASLSATDAATSATEAGQAAQEAADAATAAVQDDLEDLVSQANTAATNAATSEENAETSAAAAASSASSASTSATSADTSATAAAGSAGEAAGYEADAQTAADDALVSKNAAAASATTALTNATNSSANAASALASANAATASKNAAAASAQAAADSAAEAAAIVDIGIAEVGVPGLVAPDGVTTFVDSAGTLTISTDAFTLEDGVTIVKNSDGKIYTPQATVDHDGATPALVLDTVDHPVAAFLGAWDNAGTLEQVWEQRENITVAGADKLTTARTFQTIRSDGTTGTQVPFDGSQNIQLLVPPAPLADATKPGALAQLTVDTTGITVDSLVGSAMVGGVRQQVLTPKGNVSVQSANYANTSGAATTATKLALARTFQAKAADGTLGAAVNFDGSANVQIPLPDIGGGGNISFEDTLITTSGNVTLQPGFYEILVVGGGGGGGGRHTINAGSMATLAAPGGGGGAGAVVRVYSNVTSTYSMPVIIGTGGAAGSDYILSSAQTTGGQGAQGGDGGGGSRIVIDNLTYGACGGGGGGGGAVYWYATNSTTGFFFTDGGGGSAGIAELGTTRDGGDGRAGQVYTQSAGVIRGGNGGASYGISSGGTAAVSYIPRGGQGDGFLRSGNGSSGAGGSLGGGGGWNSTIDFYSGNPVTNMPGWGSFGRCSALYELGIEGYGNGGAGGGRTGLGFVSGVAGQQGCILIRKWIIS